MAYDYGKLRGRIIEMYGSVADFAKEMPNCSKTIYRKLGNLSEWTQTEILESCEKLHIRNGEIGTYFFTVVGEKSTNNGTHAAKN
jgi:hypothetical protein